MSQKTNYGFITNIKSIISKNQSHICVGLDSDYEKIPNLIKKNVSIQEALFQFNKKIIDVSYSIVAAYKLNYVFYSAYGIDGIRAIIRTNRYIKKVSPHTPIICDSKRNEMGRSAILTAQEMFTTYGFDAFTVTPWFGQDTVSAYVHYVDKAVFVLCHDSNPSAGDIQDSLLKNKIPLYKKVTDLVSNTWNTTGNILIEAPLTYPHILRTINSRSAHDQFFLIAGLGAQKGKISDLHIFAEKKNFIINASRSIIFADNSPHFAEKAQKQIIQYNQKIALTLHSSIQ